MADWSAIKTLIFTFGPIVVPYLWGQYRKVRVQINSAGPAHPPPPKIYNALSILGLTIGIFVVLSFPYFQPENVFTLTKSRMQTPNNVLFERIKQLRPNKQLNFADETFQIRLQMTEARCLYLKYGPEAILDCLWCSPMKPMTYNYYTLPDIMGPHLWNALAVGLATSKVVAGPEGSRWRFRFSFGALALAFADFYYCYSWDWSFNAKTKSADQLVYFYWRMRSLRPIMISLFDAALASALWLSSTGRFFLQPPSSAEKLDSLTQQLSEVNARINSAGILQNTISRDAGLREHSNQYWQSEGQIMQDVMAEPEVVQSVNKAVGQRLNMTRVERDAKSFSENLMQAQLTT